MSGVKQLVLLSGKGGTGKTSVAAAFAHLAEKSSLRAILADADVDAANLGLMLAPRREVEHSFQGGSAAVIDPGLCTECGLCGDVCRFDAVSEAMPPEIDPLACEGCAACVSQCPVEAIRLERGTAGHWYRSSTEFGPLVHAELRPAEENSGKLVSRVRKEAAALASNGDYDLIIVDGPPGIGCPVISSVTGSDLALIVTEPTAAGISDLDRVFQTTRHFGVPAVICINKADIHPEGTRIIERFADRQGIEVAGRLPFDLSFVEAVIVGHPVTVLGDGGAARAVRSLWHRVNHILHQPSISHAGTANRV